MGFCPWDGNWEPGEQNHPGGPDSCANTPGLTAPVSYAQGGWSDGAAQMLRAAPTPTEVPGWEQEYSSGSRALCPTSCTEDSKPGR